MSPPLKRTSHRLLHRWDANNLELPLSPPYNLPAPATSRRRPRPIHVTACLPEAKKKRSIKFSGDPSTMHSNLSAYSARRYHEIKLCDQFIQRTVASMAGWGRTLRHFVLRHALTYHTISKHHCQCAILRSGYEPIQTGSTSASSERNSWMMGSLLSSISSMVPKKRAFP